jgi:iron(III) transport system substrate-binding protein
MLARLCRGGLACALSIVIIVVVGCSDSSQESGGNGSLVIYNGQEEEIGEAVIEAFEKKTGISTEFRHGEGFELANQILAEGPNSPADIIFTENSPEITLLAKRDRLAKVNEDTLAKVPAQYNSPDAVWVGFAARETVLVYNPDMVPEQDLPKSVLDLADERWRGKIGIAPAGADFHPLVTAVRVTKGEDAAKTWLTGLKGNALALRNNTAILRAVNDGHLSAGMINQHYWHRLRAAQGADSVRAKLHHYGNQDPGTLVNISGAAVVSSSDNQDAAQQFLAFLVSDEGQQLIVSTKDYEYPLAPGVPADPALPLLDSLNPAPVTVEQLDDGSATVELMTEVGLL